MDQRSCDNCKRIGTKWCNKCVSTAQEPHSKFKPSKTWLDSIFKECADLEKAMNELRSERIIIPTQEEGKNMEYKTKEELQSSIETMETELAKMKEALKKTEEEGVFWKPIVGSPYYFIESSFYSAYTWMSDDSCSNSRAKSFNCFKTSAECQEAARDAKTLFMLYRLSRKSMDKCSEMAAFYLMKYNPRTNTICWELTDRRERGQLCCFSTHADAAQAYKIIGKENLIELFKKF